MVIVLLHGASSRWEVGFCLCKIRKFKKMDLLILMLLINFGSLGASLGPDEHKSPLFLLTKSDRKKLAF